MRLEYYYSKREEAFPDDPANVRLDDVSQLLQRIEKEDIASVESIDTSSYSREKLYHIYLRAAMAAVRNKYAVRQVFGTRAQSGTFFGRQVPALLIYQVEDSPFPDDLYPHVKNRRTIPIATALRGMILASTGVGTTLEEEG